MQLFWIRRLEATYLKDKKEENLSSVVETKT